MANTYTWAFNFDVCNHEQNGHLDCIQTVHWRLSAVNSSVVDAEGNPLSVSAYGTAAVATPEEGCPDYIAFDDITPEWAKEKTLASLDKTEAELQAVLDERLSEMAAPATRQAVPASWA
jgi:hypothetical protein